MKFDNLEKVKTCKKSDKLTITCMIDPWRNGMSVSCVRFSGASFLALIVVCFSFFSFGEKDGVMQNHMSRVIKRESLKMGKSAHFGESLLKVNQSRSRQVHQNRKE